MKNGKIILNNEQSARVSVWCILEWQQEKIYSGALLSQATSTTAERLQTLKWIKQPVWRNISWHDASRINRNEESWKSSEYTTIRRKYVWSSVLLFFRVNIDIGWLQSVLCILNPQIAYQFVKHIVLHNWARSNVAAQCMRTATTRTYALQITQQRHVTGMN